MYHFMQRILIGLFVVLLVSGLSPIQARPYRTRAILTKTAMLILQDFLVFSSNFGNAYYSANFLSSIRLILL